MAPPGLGGSVQPVSCATEREPGTRPAASIRQSARRARCMARRYRAEAAPSGCSFHRVTRDKRLVLIAAVMGTAVVSIASTVVNVALPAIRSDLGGGLAGQQWISNSYLLTLSSLILVAGSLGDLFGERRVFVIGVAGFGVASVVCALAPTIELLVAARALQGVFGALLTPSSLAVIAAKFPPEEPGRAVGLGRGGSGIGIVGGPVNGAQLVDSASWRSNRRRHIPLGLST